MSCQGGSPLDFASGACYKRLDMNTTLTILRTDCDNLCIGPTSPGKLLCFIVLHKHDVQIALLALLSRGGAMNSADASDTWERRNPYEKCRPLEPFGHREVPLMVENYCRTKVAGCEIRCWSTVRDDCGQLLAITERVSNPRTDFCRQPRRISAAKGRPPPTLWENVRTLESIATIPANH